jgi:hypothetical protein
MTAEEAWSKYWADYNTMLCDLINRTDKANRLCDVDRLLQERRKLHAAVNYNLEYRKQYMNTYKPEHERIRIGAVALRPPTEVPNIILNDLFGGDGLFIKVSLSEMEQVMNMAIDVATIRLSFEPNGLINTITWPEESAIFNAQYEGADKLPTNVQEKLAVLMTLDPKVSNHEVNGIGRRISESIFWVYMDGEHTREEGEDQGT